MMKHLWKKMSCPVWAFVTVVVGLGLYACNNNDDAYYYYDYMPNAIVTVKSDGQDRCFFQLDDSTTLLPLNVPGQPYGDKEVRALINFTLADKPSDPYTQAVYVHWMDSVLTKNTAPDLGEENDAVYGTDPVEILNSWLTVSEDGYLTLNFSTLSGNASTKHYVNLLTGLNPDNPYEVEFRHNAYGDVEGHQMIGLVAFRLDDLPDTQGETVKLTLKWNSYSGVKTHEFDYCTREASETSGTAEVKRSELQMK